MHVRDLQARWEISYPACDQCSFRNHSLHGDPEGGNYISTHGLKNPSGDEFENHGWGGFQLVFRFTGEPEGPVDVISTGSPKIVWLWIDFGMLLLLEGPIHVFVGHHPIVHY